MRATIAVLIFVLLLIGSTALWAYPTFGGATGLITQPTAELAPRGSLTVAGDYQKLDAESIWIGRANVGFSDDLEIWAGYTKLSDSPTGSSFIPEVHKIWNGGAKYATQVRNIPVTVGGSFGKMQDDPSITVYNAFLVADKDPGTLKLIGSPDVKLTLGGTWIKLKDSSVNGTVLQPFGGLVFSNDKGISLAVEYRPKDSDVDEKALFSAALRYPVNDTITVQVGTTNGSIGGLGGNDSDIFFGLSYCMKGKQVSSDGDTYEIPTRTRRWGY